MAVTLANELSNRLEFSGIIVTRAEGSLKESISDKVDYFFLRKIQKLDFFALLRLRKHVKQNNINIIHAHGSSYFFAVLLKLTLPDVNVFWHDHYGNRVKNNNLNFYVKIASYFFRGVFVVNQDLQKWALQNLKTSNIKFIPNFIEDNVNEKKVTFLKGEKGKRIIIVANLREPKNHNLAISAFSKSGIASLGWTLHFVGKDKFDEYSNNLKLKIVEEKLSNSVFIYGSCVDVQHILSQTDVGLLTSKYEGFPVTLLEYAKANLLVVCSNVGYCNQIIKNQETGYCFESENENELEKILKSIPYKSSENALLAIELNCYVNQNYSAKNVINEILLVYQNKDKKN